MDRCADLFDLPATIGFGDQALHMPDAAAIVSALETYRGNLLVESYDHSDAKVTHVSEVVDRSVNVISTWLNIDEHGAVMSELEGNFILRDYPETGWRITRLEYLTGDKRRMMDGMPLI